MVLAAEFLAIPSSAVKIASERRCAIVAHSGGHQSWVAQGSEIQKRASGRLARTLNTTAHAPEAADNRLYFFHVLR